MTAREAAFSLEFMEQEAVLRARGAVDAENGPTIERVATGAFRAGLSALNIDLSECPLLDSAGVRALIRIRRRADEAGIALRLSRCSDAAERVLRAMHLDGFFHLPLPTRPPRMAPPNGRFHRFSLVTPVHIWDGLVHRTGETRGLSPEGMVMEMPGPLRVFEVLRVEMSTPDTGERFRFMGRVVNWRPGQPGTAEVEFLSLDPAMRLWLQRHTPGATKSAPKPPKPQQHP